MDPAITDTEKAPTSPEKCHSDVVFRATLYPAVHGMTIGLHGRSPRIAGSAVWRPIRPRIV